MPDDPRKRIEKVGMMGDIRIETAYFFPSSDLSQDPSANREENIQNGENPPNLHEQNPELANQEENIQNGENPPNLHEQNPELLQEPQKILEPSPGINLNSNVSTHATALSSCQEQLSQLKVSLHRIYRNTSGTTSQVSKSDIRNLIQLLSSADELLGQVWQEISEEEEGL